MDVGPLPRRRREGDGPPPWPAPAAGERDEGGGVLPGPVPSDREPRLRRAWDLVGATVLLVVTLPLLAVGMLVVALRAGRPIFFAHRRIGKGGRPFRCWKLRTMEPGAEDRLREDPDLRRRHREGGFKLPAGDDPRVVPGTVWLRRSHVDELPQLLNVLRGEMSLVGPRPVVREELACYGDGWRILLSRRPGLMGAWTAEGPRRPDYPERARLELEYVRRAGFGTDLRILARTLLAPFRRRAGG